MPSAAFAFCSTSRTVLPSSRSLVTIEKMSLMTSGASPIEGSSIMISLGRAMSALAMASICCSPPESVPASCRSRSLRRGKSP